MRERKPIGELLTVKISTDAPGQGSLLEALADVLIDIKQKTSAADGGDRSADGGKENGSRA